MQTLILCSFFIFIVPDFAKADQEIRIAIGKPSFELMLKGPNLKASDMDGKTVAQRDTMKISADSAGIVIDGKKSDLQTIFINSPSNILVGEGQYRNNLEVKWQLERGKPQLVLIHSLPLENYVVGIVSSEVPHSWPLEALKAQAIAARTFAVWQKFRRLDKSYHLESSVMDQVYAGAQKEHGLAKQAGQKTAGQILTYQGKPIQAYFHAACGGQTESALDAWGNDLPYLPGSKCGHCKTAAKFYWTYSISKRELSKALKSIFPGGISYLKITQKTKSGRAKTIEISGRGQNKQISGPSFREMLGYNNIRSTLIDKISMGWSEVTFKGRGHGHGVGMCQWGAMDMGKSGSSAEKILKIYYPLSEIRQLY